MASKDIIATHVANLKLIKDQGGDAQDALDYMADPKYKVNEATAKQIFNDPEFRKAFIDTDANVARQTLGQGTFLGFGDEAEGFARGLYEGLTTDKPFDKAIDENIDKARANVELYQKARPYKATALQVAGGVPTGLFGMGRALALRGAGLLPRMIEGAKQGATHGFFSGLGRGEGGFDRPGLESRGLSGLVGSGTGAFVGAGVPVVGDFLRGGGNVFGQVLPKSQATRQAGRLMRRAIDDDETTVPAIRAALTTMPAKARIPDAPDIYSIGLRDLARQAATTSGGKGAHQFLAERHAEQGQRMLEQVDKFLPTQSLNDYLEEVTVKRSEAANQQYGELRSRQLKMTDDLKYFLNHPKIKEVWEGAQNLAEWEDVTLPEAVAVLDGANAYAKPTLQVMDYLKRSLDGRVNRAFAANDTEDAHAAKVFRNKLRDFLDKVIPEYKEARSVYAGHSAALEAAQEGKKFVLRPGTFDHSLFKKFGDHEMESFRVGVADALRQQILETPYKSDAVNKIFNNEAKKMRLKQAFNNDAEFDAFEKAMRDEEQMALTSVRATTGSRSAPMLSDMAAGQDITDAADLATGGGGSLVRFLTQSMGETAPPDAVAAELRRLLLDPANQEEALKIMGKGSPVIRRRAAQMPSILRNVLAQQSPRPLVEDRSP